MRYLFVLLILTTAGCESAQQRRDREDAENQARAAAYRDGVRNQCRGYGFKDDTPEFRDCLMRVDTANRAQWEAQRQMLLQQHIQQQGIFRSIR